MERKDFRENVIRPRNGLTVRDHLLRLHRAVEEAEADRGAYLTALRLEGHTLRQLSQVLNVAPSTVMRWAPIESDTPSLDDPAEQATTTQRKAA